MRGSPARTYDTPPSAAEYQPFAACWLEISGTYAEPERSPMLKSVLKSACRSGLRSVPGAWAAAGLLWAVPVITVPIVAIPVLAVPSRGLAAESIHCLSGDEQRAASAGGKAVPLATVIHTLHRAPKDVIKAQLCQEPDRLVYKLTLLGRDGKVKRATVDAINGSVVGER